METSDEVSGTADFVSLAAGIFARLDTLDEDVGLVDTGIHKVPYGLSLGGVAVYDGN